MNFFVSFQLFEKTSDVANKGLKSQRNDIKKDFWNHCKSQKSLVVTIKLFYLLSKLSNQSSISSFAPFWSS